MIFLVVMILVLPVVYVLSSAPVLALAIGDSSLVMFRDTPQWWETLYGPLVRIDAKMAHSSAGVPMMKWFELWRGDGYLETSRWYGGPSL